VRLPDGELCGVRGAGDVCSALLVRVACPPGRRDDD
jgi:hypothetical protein